MLALSFLRLIASDSSTKLTAAESKLEGALNAAKTQSQYLLKLARELKQIRATFDEISVTVNLHGAVDMTSLLSDFTSNPESLRSHTFFSEIVCL